MKDKVKNGVLVTGAFLALLGGGVIVNKSNSPTTENKLTIGSANTLTADESDYLENHGASDCTSDCSGHDAGYEWARENDICAPQFDGGNSDSFAEGVIAYAYDTCYYSRDDQPI